MALRPGPGPSGRTAHATRRALAAGLAFVLGALGAGLVSGAPAGAEARSTYVALGDSFAAGDGVPVQGTGPAMCARSSADYPHVLAAALGLALDDVTCSGATTADVLGPQRSSDTSVPAQTDALGPDDALVTLTIGGNDLGFSGIVARCLAATPWGPTLSGKSRTCRQTSTSTGRHPSMPRSPAWGRRWPRC